jgi:hypothetical protein
MCHDPQPPTQNPYRVAPLGALPASEPGAVVPLTGSERVIPLLDHVVGEIRADGQNAKVMAASLTADGAIGFLNLVGPATTLGAVVGRLHQNKPVVLATADEFGGEGITLKRLIGVSYTQHHTRVKRIGQGNLLVHPTTLSVDAGVRSPAVPTISRDRDGMLLPPGSGPEVPLGSRFVIANHGEETPSLARFLGTLYGMRVPFPMDSDDQAHWAAVLWAYGLQTTVRPGASQHLITLFRPLGVRVWEVAGNPILWWGLVSQLVMEGVLPLRACAL